MTERFKNQFLTVFRGKILATQVQNGNKHTLKRRESAI